MAQFLHAAPMVQTLPHISANGLGASPPVGISSLLLRLSVKFPVLWRKRPSLSGWRRNGRLQMSEVDLE